MTDFGIRIKQVRFNRGLSQEELAEQVGISRNYLSQIERGISANISFDVARRLGQVLGLTLDEPQLPDIPESLRQFSEQADLQAGEVKVLAGIEYRGKRPRTVEDWRLLQLAIKSATAARRGREDDR